MKSVQTITIRTKKTRTVMIMAAGTGGHIIPGLALASALTERGWKVIWLGTAIGMENRLVPAAGIRLEHLAFSGLRGKNSLTKLKGIFQLAWAGLQSIRWIKCYQPDVVVGMGGYVCVPGGWAAWLTRRPLLLVNADASLLLSNKILLPFARFLACGFDGSAARSTSKARVTGNPIRSAIANLPAPAIRFAKRSGSLSILIVGGSLGAKALNEAVPQALAQLAPEQRPHVVHQSGEAHFAAVKALYATLGLENVDVLPFIDDMPSYLSKCDLVICRAGAITISELCAGGIASILIPLVVSTTAHQKENALWMEKQGAAIYLPQTEAMVEKLVQYFSELDRTRLLAMAQNARQQALPEATLAVAKLCEDLASHLVKK